jgi:protein TonB
MFEDSTFESMGIIRTRSRGWMLATFAINGSILLTLVLLPLIYPEALPSFTSSILMTAPAAPVEEPKPQPAVARTAIVQPQVHESDFQAPSIIPKYIPANDGSEVSSSIDLGNIGAAGNGTASPDNPWSSRNPIIVVQQPPKATAHISRGVMDGLLYQKTLPAYPPIAKAAGMEGTVVLQATISKNGTIENLRVMSGPALLQQAALDAVRQWRYRPYLLNGEPIEVETTVNVVFKLN